MSDIYPLHVRQTSHDDMFGGHSAESPIRMEKMSKAFSIVIYCPMLSQYRLEASIITAYFCN